MTSSVCKRSPTLLTLHPSLSSEHDCQWVSMLFLLLHSTNEEKAENGKTSKWMLTAVLLWLLVQTLRSTLAGASFTQAVAVPSLGTVSSLTIGFCLSSQYWMLESYLKSNQKTIHSRLVHYCTSQHFHYEACRIYSL